MYVTDTLKYLVGVNVRYIDMIDRKPAMSVKEAAKTAEEIKTRIKEKISNLARK